MCGYSSYFSDCARITGKPDVIPGEKFALPVTWVRGIKLRLFAFSSVAASHDSFATGLRSGRPIFVLCGWRIVTGEPILPVVHSPKLRSTFEINKMQKRLCNMLHVPCGSRNGPGRGFR